MTKQEIITARNVELMIAPEGKSFNVLAGKKLKHEVTSVMWYDENSYLARINNASLDELFFSAVRKGYFEIPSDYDTCSRCSGEGKLRQHFNVDGGVCFKCNGFGYTKIK